MELKDKVAIVTGGTSGIGKATAVLLARRGARVMVIGRHEESGRAAVAEMGAAAGRPGDSADFRFAVVDVSDPGQLKAAIDDSSSRWGRVDVLVNNAGMMAHKRLLEMSEHDWDQVQSVNLRAAFTATRVAAGHMKRGASIVNVSSVHAMATGAESAAYAASKGGLEAFTRAAALELFDLGIRVNAVRVGAVDTEMLWENPQVKSGAESVDCAEVGQPHEVAEAILFLASDRASFVSGAVLNVDGARLTRLGSHGA